MMWPCVHRVIALSNLLGNASTANSTLVSAGAAAPQLSLASNANECSFAQLERGAVHGRPFIAVTADLPQSSVYVSPPVVICAQPMFVFYICTYHSIASDQLAVTSPESCTHFCFLFTLMANVELCCIHTTESTQRHRLL